MEQYLIYLRKSRADRDAEERGEGDTLSRHRTALLELSNRMGLCVTGIYEEVVSGETIAGRPEMRRLLRDVESGVFAGVLVMEVERLARGNTKDQGIVAETFQLSGTKIITPSKIYDPSDECDQEYFEFTLFMSRREYKAINRRMQRGRDASLQEGKYIAGSAPYGYIRVKLTGQKGYTLQIVPDKAEVVRRIFSLYITGLLEPDGIFRPCGSAAIARLLDADGIASPSGGVWQPCTVRDMLRNPTYAGMLRWSYRPIVRQIKDGQPVTSRPVNRGASYRAGLHQPIVDRKTWNAAQAILSGKSQAPVPTGRTLQNPLAGLVFCAFCGRSMERRTGKGGRDTLLCPNRACRCKSSPLEEVERTVLDALRRWLSDYRLTDVSGFLENEIGYMLRGREHEASRLSAKLAALEVQRAHLCDLLEQGVYTPGMFLDRSRLLEARAARTRASLEETKQLLQEERGRTKLPVPAISGIEQLLNEYGSMTCPQEQNELLKVLLYRVDYAKTEGGRWTPSDTCLSVFPRIR